MGVSVGLLVDCIWNGGSDLQAGVEIYHWGYGDVWVPRLRESLLDSRWIAYGMADPISKPAWRYTIEGTPNFWLI